MQDYAHFTTLKQKLEERNKSLKENLVVRHKDAFDWLNNTKQLAAGAMGSMLLLTTPMVQYLPSPHSDASHIQMVDIPEKVHLITDLMPYVPDVVGPLHASQENKISEILGGYYGMDIKSEINGMRLNTTYGYIGAEQHLMRYAGDSMASHFQTSYEANQFARSGMAPGRGAYGYFAQGGTLTQQEIEREKYYIAVQTFMSQGYASRTREYVNFFKFRKMLVVNPNNGHAVVVVIGDAGPAVWTKKHLGGSPEVMRHLERVDGAAKGGVLYFFIDDPEDKVPLGPIEPKGGL